MKTFSTLQKKVTVCYLLILEIGKLQPAVYFLAEYILFKYKTKVI